MNELFRVLLSEDIQHSTAIHYSNATTNKLIRKTHGYWPFCRDQIGGYLNSHHDDGAIQDSVANTQLGYRDAALQSTTYTVRTITSTTVA